MNILELKEAIVKRGSNVVLATNVPTATANKVALTIRGIGLIGAETIAMVNSCIPLPKYLELEDIGTVRVVNVMWIPKDTAHTAIARHNDRCAESEFVHFFSSVHRPKPQE